MSVLRPVAELWATDDDAPQWWPVPLGARFRTVVLDGELPFGEVGAFMRRVALDCRPDGVDEDAASPEDAVSWIIGADELAISGGLRAEDGAGTLIAPGCCSDLADWREWADLSERPELWLGHDPDPWIEYRDTCLRLHPRGGMGSRTPSETGFVEFSFADLALAVASAQRHLLGFLAVVARWSDGVVPRQAADLVAALDTGIGIGSLLW